jgi:hypothetical protein
MNAIDLEIRKLRFVKDFLNEENEDIVKEQLSFFYEIKHAPYPIPGVPNTVEDLKNAVRQGMDDYLNGRVISQEDLFEKWEKTQKRELGSLEGKGTVAFAEDLKK